MEQTLAMIERFVEIGRRTGKTHQVVTVNVDFLVNAINDPEVRVILQEADLATADGMPIVWGAKILGGNLEQRVTGADLVPLLIEQAARSQHSVYFLGGMPGVAAQTAELFQERYPELVIAGVFSPPFKSILEMDHNIVDRVKAAHPDILLVAFGNPKQEKWIYMHRLELNVPVSIGVGGTLDFISGRIPRAPHWMQRSGLEWFHRLILNPQRLLKRYFIDFFVFGSFLFRQWWAMKRGGISPNILPVDEPLIVGRFGILRVRGSLEIGNLNGFEQHLRALLDQVSSLILDLEMTGFIDSSAIGLLVHVAKKLRDCGGDLYLAAIPEEIAQILELLRLDQFFRIVRSIEDVLQGRVEYQTSLTELNSKNGCIEWNEKKWEVVKVPRRFDSTRAEEVHHLARNAGESTPYIIFDFSQTVFLASAGLAVLAALHHELENRDGEIVLSGCSRDVLKVLHLVHFDRFITLIPNLPSSVAKQFLRERQT